MHTGTNDAYIHRDAKHTYIYIQVLTKLLLPPWERVLWKQQPYADNYTDSTFLESLITNDNFSEYDFWLIVRDSVSVAQHLSATVIFLAMFYLTNYSSVQVS